MSAKLAIGILGGTGREGSGLGLRWAAKGHRVVLGSRDAVRAAGCARDLIALLGGRGEIEGADNETAARAGDVIVLAVPYAAQAETALAVRAHLSGKVLVDVTVPLVPPKVDRVQLPAGESAAVALQRNLGESVRVVSAFQNVSATHLRNLAHEVECDVLVCGDDAQARETAVCLARDAGMRAWHAGVLANAVAAEALTSVLIAINKRYKVAGAGLRITGIPPG